MDRIETEHHDGRSDATPGGHDTLRRPGERGFAVLLLLASLGLLWSAYGIAGFESLSSAGAIPMAATGAMVISMLVILSKSAYADLDKDETLFADILPIKVVVFVGLLIAFGLLLVPFGFLPTSAVFLVIAIRYLSDRSWLWTLVVTFGSLVVIWLIFRIVFSVLMPAGIVPEAEIIQFFRNLLSWGDA